MNVNIKDFDEVYFIPLSKKTPFDAKYERQLVQAKLQILDMLTMNIIKCKQFAIQSTQWLWGPEFGIST